MTTGTVPNLEEVGYSKKKKFSQTLKKIFFFIKAVVLNVTEGRDQLWEKTKAVTLFSDFPF